MWLSSVLNKKDPRPKNHATEQREVLLNNTDGSIDAQNLNTRTCNEWIFES